MSGLDAFSQAFHQHYCIDANARLYLGVSRDLGELPDPSRAGEDSRIAEARKLLVELGAIDPSTLDRDGALDADLARLKLQSEIHDATLEFAGRTTSPQLPKAGDEIGDGLFMLFINDPRPAEERLEDITARLEAVPDYTAAMLARLEHPVARWVDIEKEKVEGLPELFDTIEGWAKECEWAERDRLSRATNSAKAALESYLADLGKLDSHGQFHIGERAMCELIENRGITSTPAELRQMAEDFLVEIHDTLAELRVRLVQKYDLPSDASVADVHKHLNERFAVKADKLEDILDRYREERDRVIAFCKERDLFPIFPDQDLKILRTPPFMAPSIPAGAMLPPQPFREGTKLSLVYLTLSEELRDEHTALGIPSMIIHEGIPGHHLQLANAAIHPSTIRRHMNANDQAEGWTTMLEDYMLDVGIMGDLTDEARFIGKRDIARLAARVAIDLYFMSGNKDYLEIGAQCDLSSSDPFECAGSLLQEVTGFTDGRVQAELNWYSTERGYPLSYLAGNRAVWALRREVEAHVKDRLEGDDFAREFHRVFLEAGSMPVSRLRTVYVAEGMLPAEPA